MVKGQHMGVSSLLTTYGSGGSTSHCQVQCKRPYPLSCLADPTGLLLCDCLIKDLLPKHSHILSNRTSELHREIRGVGTTETTMLDSSRVVRKKIHDSCSPGH